LTLLGRWANPPALTVYERFLGADTVQTDPVQALAIGEITRLIKGHLEGNLYFQNIWVQGELSNFKHHRPSGHMYFTLKDDDAVLKCVMFRSRAATVDFDPEDGMMTLARGRIGVYERGGSYQLYVDELQAHGTGSLYLAFEQLKKRLAEEGLFEDQVKKVIPKLPDRVAVITSETGAALRDIIKVLRRRSPGASILLAPAAVQGAGAPQEIADALDNVNLLGDVDVIIVGRGGGSLEELWAFNTEAVARAIFRSQIPVIAGVGHETDFTIACLVADVRAPTPSAAAELAVPDTAALRREVRNLINRSFRAVSSRLEGGNRRFQQLATARPLSMPGTMLEQRGQRLDQSMQMLERCFQGDLKDRRAGFREACGKLNALNPLSILDRGYSILQTERGELLKDASSVAVGDRISARLSRGWLHCSVDEVEVRATAADSSDKGRDQND